MDEKELLKKCMVLLLSFDDESQAIQESEINEHLDLFSVGIIVSYFHQSYGALPIVYEPSILGDNYNKLLELCDISFSSGSFVNNSIEEKNLTLDYEIASGRTVKIISYMFSIERPLARGGLENLAVNIIVDLNTYSIVKFFTDYIKEAIHKVHISLNEMNSDDDKQHVLKEVREIRKLITKILLTFKNMFGNNDLTDD